MRIGIHYLLDRFRIWIHFLLAGVRIGIHFLLDGFRIGIHFLLDGFRIGIHFLLDGFRIGIHYLLDGFTVVFLQPMYDNRALLESSLHYLKWTLWKVSAHMEGGKAKRPSTPRSFRNRSPFRKGPCPAPWAEVLKGDNSAFCIQRCTLNAILSKGFRWAGKQ